jgi:hypothetical protein
MCDCSNQHDEQPSRRAAAKYFLGVALAAVAAVIPTRKARAGYGRCANCNCPQFAGNQALCGNCGHRYEDHW